MRNINILINEDHTVSFDNDYAGLNKENLQGNIVFNFKNFVDGEARAEVIIDNQDGYILLDKVGERYTMPIKSSLLTSDFIIMQLVIDEPGEEYPVWKSETFTLKVGYSINATSQIPDDYPSWIEILEGLKSEVETAVEQAENVNIESEQLDDGVKVITTDKYGNETTTIVPQGPKGDKGDAGAIKVLKVNELPTEDIKDDTIYLVPMPVIEVETLPATGQMYTIYVVTSTQKRYRYVSGQWVETLSNDNNLEYMYIDNAWELVGQADIEIDLTDYVKNTDYATKPKGGVIKVDNYYGLYMYNGTLIGQPINYSTYADTSQNVLICKGTLENVIIGKGLVSNTNYAGNNNDVAGVIKVFNTYGLMMDNAGAIKGNTFSYANYQTATDYAIVSVGTLKNVMTATIGDIQTLLDNLDTGSGV